MTHVGIHLDEIVALILIVLFGEEKFPGAGAAEIQYVTDDVLGMDEEFFGRKTLRVGVGRGMYDDKNPDGSRKENTSTAEIVAQDLKAAELPGWKELLREVTRNDSEGGSKPTELPSLIGAANRLGRTSELFAWARTAVTVIVGQLARPLEAAAGEKGIGDYLVVWGEGLDGKIPTALAHLAHIFTDSSQNESCLSLDYIVRAMQRQKWEGDTINAWLTFAFTLLYTDRLAFEAAVRRIKPNRTTFKGEVSESIMVRSGERSLRVLIIEDDEPRASAVMTFLRFDVSVIRSTDGHVQIFANRHSGVTLLNVIAMIRGLELPADERTRVQWDALTKAGEYPGVEHWYNPGNGLQFLNGAMSKPGKKPTTLSLEEIVRAVRAAFDEESLRRWKVAHGFRVDGAKSVHEHGRRRRKDPRDVQLYRETSPIANIGDFLRNTDGDGLAALEAVLEKK